MWKLVALLLLCILPVSASAENDTQLESPQEQYEYGAALIRFASLPKDRLQGIGLVVKAAHAGHAEAQFDLGMLFEGGLMGEVDTERSREWVDAAANKGSVRAQLLLAQRLYSGDVYDKDMDQAALWYLAAAAQGEANAQNNVAHMLEHGIVFQQDLARAEWWYENAARRGNTTAQYNIATVLAAENDTGTAAESSAWYEAAAKGGHPIAQHRLGQRYRDGKGLDKDPYKAVFWLAESAKSGRVEADKDLRELLDWEGHR